MAEQGEKKILVQDQAPVVLLVITDDVPEEEYEAESITTQQQNEGKNQSLFVPETDSANEKETSQNDDDALHHGAVEEESSELSVLPENEKQALQELKTLVQNALNTHEFGISSSSLQEKIEKKTEQLAKMESLTEQESFPDPSAAKTVSEDDGAKTLEAIEETIIACFHFNPVEETKSNPEEVFIWGVKLLEDERTDVILLKFLRARDFDVEKAFFMLKNTIQWRKDFGIDELVEEDFGSELEKVVFMSGFSNEGNPVCYNVYGAFQNRELYEKMFGDEEKRQRFLRWRIQFLEKSIRKLDFRPCGVSTILQVNDLKNSSGVNKWEIRQATKQALHLLQDNYPEFVAKQVFINVPWWYLALNKLISPFLTQRSKSKFVVAGPSTSAETLFKFISAEQVPAEYGGLSRDEDFGTTDFVTEITIKPSAKHIVEFPVTQACLVTWESRVVGWEVSYGAEFVPSTENGYTIIVQKAQRIGSNQEQVISSCYKVDEPGKVVLTITNLNSKKKKKLLYRFKTKLSAD